MKKQILLFLCLSSFFVVHSTTTINVPTAGTLNTLIASGDKASITSLILTGTLDARDVKYLRDQLVNLGVLDISTVTINSYSGTDGTINSDANYPVNELPASSFCFSNGSGKTSLKAIALPNSITSIGAMAFQYCTNLTNTVIPSSVTSLGASCFYACNKFTSITIPASVSTIGSYALDNLWGVKEYIVDANNPNFSSANGVLFNKAITKLILFPKNANATTYAIPGTVTTIDDRAFQYCFGLTQVSIPVALTTIVDNAFGNCRGLTEFVVDAANTNFSALNGCLFNKNQTTLIICPAGKKGNYTIPNTATSIQTYAFSGCTTLTSVVIGTSVSSIGSGAFTDCWKMISISSARTNPLSLTNPYVFGGMNNTKWTLFVPVGSKDAYLAANQWKDVPTIQEGFPAIVETDNASSITATSIATGGNVSSEGTSTVTERGICWGFSDLPTIADFKTAVGSGAGTFTSPINSLTAGQMYHVRAYAISAVGTAYGSDITFVTVGTPPTVSTTHVSSITKTSAIAGGNIISIGTSSASAFGVCWSTTANPTINDNSTIDGSGNGSFTSSITGLSQGITYHYRAYATNYSGTSYGEDLTFVTNTTGLSDKLIGSIMLYPNPAIENIQIKNLDGVGSFTLTDLSGRQLITRKVTNNEFVSVSDLPKGIYIVKITTKDGTIEKKVVKD